MYPKTERWMNRIISDHYSKSSLPKWVKKDELYEELRDILFESLEWSFNHGDKKMSLGNPFLSVLSSNYASVSVEEDIWVTIPDAIITELSSHFNEPFKAYREEDEEEGIDNYWDEEDEEEDEEDEEEDEDDEDDEDDE